MSVILSIFFIALAWSSPTMPLETKYLAAAIIVAGGLAGLRNDKY